MEPACVAVLTARRQANREWARDVSHWDWLRHRLLLPGPRVSRGQDADAVELIQLPGRPFPYGTALRMWANAGNAEPRRGRQRRLAEAIG
jgi:hypothetical protein